MLPFMADEDNTILRHLKGGQFFKPLSPAISKSNPSFQSFVHRWITVFQFSWYRQVGPPVEKTMDAIARINAEKLEDVIETIQWPIGSLYGQQHARKTVYTVSFCIYLN